MRKEQMQNTTLSQLSTYLLFWIFWLLKSWHNIHEHAADFLDHRNNFWQFYPVNWYELCDFSQQPEEEKGKSMKQSMIHLQDSHVDSWYTSLVNMSTTYIAVRHNQAYTNLIPLNIWWNQVWLHLVRMVRSNLIPFPIISSHHCPLLCRNLHG